MEQCPVDAASETPVASGDLQLSPDERQVDLLQRFLRLQISLYRWYIDGGQVIIVS
jgi:hypothetical protein